MFVYFSSSSQFINENKDIYNKIINVLSKNGYSLISNWVDDKSKPNPEKLFEEASDAIRKSDLLVAEITNPSTGVGQQISLAIAWKLPVIMLIKENVKDSSRFTLGMDSPLLKKVEYNFSSIELKLHKSLEKIKKNNFVKFNFLSTRDINDFLEKRSCSKGVSKSEFLREIVESWMKSNN